METEQRVVVVDVNMKFGTMVMFLVKLAIAAIPAAIILFVLGALASALMGGVLHGLTTHI
ncbi:MAG: hypothetical protein ACREVQ_11090 [Burkholderiales bacterium]